MTNFNPPRDRMNFFVTHVRVHKSPWLQICGQMDRNNAREVERLITILKDDFDRGVGKIIPPNLPTNICCAFHEDNYYRAKILEFESESRIFVEFIDYGNSEYIHLTQIRLLEISNEGLRLQSIPTLMIDFPLTAVMPINNTWSQAIIDAINNLLRYREFPVETFEVGHQKKFTLYYNGRDFAEYLVHHQMALMAPTAHEFRPTNEIQMMRHRQQHQQPQPPQLQQSQYQPQLQQPQLHLQPLQMSNAMYRAPIPTPPPSEPPGMNMNNNDNYQMRLRQPRSILSNKPTQENWRRPHPSTVQQMRPPGSVSPRSQDSAAFKSRNLERNTKHQVLVSDVEDGPLKFNVQLQSCAQELDTLSRNLNSLPLKPLSEPPIHGAACLALYSKTKHIRRAVVSTVIDTYKVKVWYCDYGDQEVLPHSSIYEIPPNYANPQALSIIFTLSGVRELTVTPDMKQYFKELVLGKTLTLVVMPREDSPLMHYGNLFLDDKSVLEMLLEAFPDSTIKFPEAPLLTPGTRENVHVSYLHACSKFFVQLDKNVLDMEALSNHITECVKIAPPIKAATIKVGLKCLAQSTAENEWYRAEVISIVDNYVTVHYVDYGNDEKIPCNALRSIRSEELTKIPVQAVQCILNGFEGVPYNPEVDNKVEGYVLEKPLVMSVIEVKSSGIVVDLYDSTVKPIVNISAKLRNGTLDVTSPPPVSQPQPQSQPQSAPTFTPQYQDDVTDNSKRNFREKRSDMKTQSFSTSHPHTAKAKNIKNTRDDNDSWTSKNPNDSYPQSHENSSFENNRAKNWKNADNEGKRFNTREQMLSARDWSGHCDRSNRDYTRDERSSAPRYDRNDANDRYDNDNNMNVRRDRYNSGQGRSSQLPSGRDRYNRNNTVDSSWSDKDSNASSRGSGGRGRRPQGGGPRGGTSQSKPFGRGGNYSNGGISLERRDRPRSTSNQNENEFERNFKSNNRSHDFNNYNSPDNTRYRQNDQRNDRNKRSEIDVWEPVTAVTTNSVTNKFSPAKYTKPQIIQIAPPNVIPLGSVIHAEICYSKSPTNFFLHLKANIPEFEQMMEKIAQIYQTGGRNLSKADIHVGKVCIAEFPQDQGWYRAVIQEVKEFGVNYLAKFIDYGNTKDVLIEKIKEIDPEFTKLPIQSISCKLFAASKTTWEISELQEFSSLTDCKLLEAEFVAEDNGVYEVLLREVKDSDNENSDSKTLGPNGYVNERFSNGADVLQAKEIAQNKNRSSRSEKLATHTPATNYASLEQKWGEPRINIPMQEDVIVTWLTDPDNFYCQLLSRSKDFRSMMNEIQKIYPRRQPAQDNIVVGSSVIAVFADDGAFYRADVLETKSGDFVVRYVDFGNTAVVKSSEVYRVDKKFMDLPKQAVLCGLKNIVPPGSSWSNASHDEIDRLFNVEHLRCNFQEHNNNKYLVSLTHNGQDMVDILVQNGLATVPTSQVAEGTVESNLPQIDISYLRGQILRVKVSKVEGVNKFYIQLPSADANDKIIDNYMANQDQKVMPKLLPNEVCLGAGCLVHTDKGWRRAVVVNFITQTTNYDVRFIDTGEIDVIPLNCMLALSGELSAMQKQAVECSLVNVVSSPADNNTFRSQVENKEVIIRIKEVNYNRLVVEVFDESGRKIRLQNEVDESISPVCPMPIFFHQHQVSVSHVNNSKSIWLKRDADEDTDASLLNDLFEYYSTSGQLLNIEVNKLCAAQCSDANWYRARIISRTGSGASVLYIDYGNTEEVSSDKLKELEPKFFKPPQLAIEVRLTFNLGGGMKEQEILSTHVLNNSFNATLQLNSNDEWTVSLNMKTGQPLEDALRELGILEQGGEEITNEVPVAEPDVDEPENLIVGGKFRVVVSHVENPTQFWIQRLNELPALEQLEKQLQVDALNYLPIEGVPEENLICAALDTANSLWNRAEVIVADTEMVTVRYVDYGNTDVLLDMSKIKQLPDSMKSIKCYATKCRLDLIPIDCEDWSETAINYFADKTVENENLTAVVIADGSSKRIDLIDENGSITKLLVNENMAKQIQAHEDVIDEVVENVLDPRSAFICHINSPDEFWVQEEKSVADLEHIADRFLVADMFPRITQVVPGELCVAKFPDDNSWYRARIISHGPMGTNVFYIDYGNSAVSTEIRVIPDDVSGIPPLSRKSRLPLPPRVEQWSDAAREEFARLADDGATIFFLDVLEEGDTSTVKLTLNGENIVDILEKFCEKKSTVESSVEVEPEVDKSINTVFVSHVNSPYDFYIQEEKHTGDLDVMIERLTSADTFLPVDEIREELLCIALFPEDSAWYRARILSHGNEGTQVIFIDYGNTAVTTELRKIPSDLETVSPLSLHCRLDSNVEWPYEAYQEFIKLVDGGNSKFVMNIKNKTDEISTVQLLFNGQDVTEMLNQHCSKSVPVIEERLPPIGEETTPNVMISHLISPSEFWIQAENQISDLELMVERLVNAESFSPLEAATDGIICAAKFPEDNLWYRAKILTHDEANGIEVLFIDYGNSSLASETRQLPEDLAKIPPLSKCCSLIAPNDDCWSLEACEKFIELVADGETLFEYKELQGQDPTYVDLIYNGQDVVEILALLSKKTSSTVIDQKDAVAETITNIECKIEKPSICENIKMEREFDSHTYERDESNLSSSTSGVDVLTNSDNSNESNPFEKIENSEIMNSTLKQTDVTGGDFLTGDTLILESHSETVSETLAATVIENVRYVSETVSADIQLSDHHIKTPPAESTEFTTDSLSAPIDIQTCDITIKESPSITTEDEVSLANITDEKEDTVSSEEKISSNDASIVEPEQKSSTSDINTEIHTTETVVIEPEPKTTESDVNTEISSAEASVIESEKKTIASDVHTEISSAEASVIESEQKTTASDVNTEVSATEASSDESEQLTSASDVNTTDVIENQDTVIVEEKLSPVEATTDILGEEQNAIAIEEKISPLDSAIEEQESIIIEEEIILLDSSPNKTVVTEEQEQETVAVTDSLVVKEKDVRVKEQATPTPDSSIPPSPIGDMPRYERRNSTPHEDKIVPGSINKGIELVPDDETIEVEVVEKSSD